MAATESTPSVNVLAEVLKWSGDRPTWQCDALRRIVTAGGITEQDLDELEQLCRFPHGVPRADMTAPTPTPLSEAHIGTRGGSCGEPVSLVGISSLKRVNRIPEDARLTFGTAPGLTVVFGPNGAGKSGYARVLKNACQTRGARPAIHPNAHLPRPAGPATADITARLGTAEFTHAWVDGTPPDPRLAQAFVFDAATAEHYLSSDGPTTFTPFGLDILPKLSHTCDRVKERIERERADLDTRCRETAATWGISGETATGRFLQGLSARTEQAEIDAATAFSPADEATRAELEATLRADPRVKAKSSRASATRIESFVGKCETRLTQFSEDALNRLSGRIRATLEAEQVAKAFSEKTIPAGVLPGTGGDLWKRLWAAAEEFATSSACPDLPFPPVADGREAARCVLCQQTLAPDAQARMANFAAFMADQSQRLAAKAREGLAGVATRLDSMQPLAPEATAIEADVGDALAATINAFAAASDSLLLAIRDHVHRCDPSPLVPALLDLAPLRTLARQTRERADREEAARDPTRRSELQRQWADLEARATAARRKAEIVAHVETLRRAAALAQCVADAATTAITRKNTELTELVVSRAFLDAFAARLDDLGLRTIQVEMSPLAGQKGQAKYGIRLKPVSGGTSASVSVDAVASEGEQRCISLAAFLAELSQATHRSTLVFDDPVCSLDHNYRARVAVALAEQALQRQVIVFTHDLVFLHDLGAAAEDRGISPAYRCVEWGSNAPGVCREDVPWEGKRVEAQLTDLETRQLDLARACAGLPNQTQTREILDVYSHMRGTLERIIEDKLLEGGLIRFHNEVKVGKLRALVGFSQAEFDGLATLHGRCSELTRAHSSAAARQLPTPSPSDLARDLAATRELIQRIKSRKAAVSASSTPGAASPPPR